MAGQRRRLVTDALHQVAITAQHEDAVVTHVGAEAGARGSAQEMPIPTPLAKPCPRGAGGDLDPLGAWCTSGWPRSAGCFTLAELAQVVEGQAVASEGRAMSTGGSSAWPHDSRNRSRSGQSGWLGSWRTRSHVHSTWASGARAMAVQGWPLPARCGPSMAKPRMTLMPSCSEVRLGRHGHRRHPTHWVGAAQLLNHR